MRRPPGPPALAAGPSAATLRRFQERLFPFPDPDLDRAQASAPTAAQLRAWGGRLFPDAPRLVRAVARGLQRAPALFRDIPVCGAGLAERQERADAWRQLRDSLRLLADLANARYLREQAGAIDDASAVLRQLDHWSRMPFRPADLAARRAALGEAVAIFARLQERRRRSARAALQRGRAAADERHDAPPLARCPSEVSP